MLWRLRTRHREPALRMSDTFAYQNAPRSLRVRFSWLPEACGILAFVLLVIALATISVIKSIQCRLLKLNNSFKIHALNSCDEIIELVKAL